MGRHDVCDPLAPATGLCALLDQTRLDDCFQHGCTKHGDVLVTPTFLLLHLTLGQVEVHDLALDVLRETLLRFLLQVLVELLVFLTDCAVVLLIFE